MAKVKDFFINFYNTKRKLFVGIVVGLTTLIIFGVIVFFLFLKLPTPPRDLMATVRSYESIRLTWIDQQKSDGYNIYRSQESAMDYERVASTANRHFLDEELDPETTYYYRVTKIQKGKESNYSMEIHATTSSVGVVENLRSGEVGHDHIQLVWDGFRGSEGYTVYRTDRRDRPYERIDTTTNEYYFDSGLENNTPYYYVVTQMIEGRESEYSSQLLTATRDWTCGTSISYDGKFYATIQIGEQCWFRENLNYEVEGGSWCYNNEEKNCDDYGRIYSWEVAMVNSLEEGAQGICPQGWYIPTDEDFKTLEREIGMTRVESNESEWRGQEMKIGDRLKVPSSCKEAGQDFCGSSSMNITLGGSRSSAGAFRYLGTHSFLWTSTLSVGDAYRRLLALENEGIHREKTSTENGFYVRCIKK